MDASLCTIGAVLSQEREDEERVIAFGSLVTKDEGWEYKHHGSCQLFHQVGRGIPHSGADSEDS